MIFQPAVEFLALEEEADRQQLHNLKQGMHLWPGPGGSSIIESIYIPAIVLAIFPG